jgi:hypothetical protein
VPIFRPGRKKILGIKAILCTSRIPKAQKLLKTSLLSLLSAFLISFYLLKNIFAIIAIFCGFWWIYYYLKVDFL